MAQLTTTDAGPWGNPGPDRHASMAMGAAAVVAGPAPGNDRIATLLAERFEPGFEPARHVQRVALPQPGDDADLFRAIAHALERPLDPARPLWECWIIEGLRGNRWAILIKAHHGMTPAARLLAQLCDGSGDDAFTNAVALKQVSPLARESWPSTLLRAPLNVAKAAARAVSDATSGLAAAVGTLATLTSPVGSQNTLRHYRTVRVSRTTAESVARKLGVGLDDVALAAVTEGFRTVLADRGEQPRADSLRTVGSALSQLPVHLHDPVMQLRAVHHATTQGLPAPAEYSPLALCNKVIQAFTGTSRNDVVTLATHGRGPRQPLTLMGRQVAELLPIPPTAPELSTGVAVLGYGDELVFGLTADYDGAAVLEQLATGIEAGIAHLAALTQDSVVLFERRRRRPARPLSNGAARWRPSAQPVRARRP
ncbi:MULTISPECIES: wax ester/triacylglycerol synthase domain-containing protein [Mycobacterium]|nr:MULTISPECIES: wax ester/triacylglycerol synthase domain-containing protein [Mycobacterium]